MPRIIDFVRNKNKADNGSGIDSDGGSISGKDPQKIEIGDKNSSATASGNDKTAATNLANEDKADAELELEVQRSDKSLEVEVEPSPDADTDADADADADADTDSTVTTESETTTTIATPAAESVAPNPNVNENAKEEITLGWRISEKESSATKHQEELELEQRQEQQQQQERSTSKGTGTNKGKASIQLHQQANPNKEKFVEHLIECSSISATKTPMTRISCHVEDTISNHPVLLITASLTTILCLYMLCRKRLRRIRQWNRSRMYGLPYHSAYYNGSNLDQGEYAALAVYDELLEDFDRDELSSAYTSGKSANGNDYDDDDDDDSIGTIISQWSDNGTRQRVAHKIELTAFNDGHLSLSEING